MQKTDDHLTDIKDRLATGERVEPERMLSNLIRQMGSLELSDWRRDIEGLADQFQKKRRNNILRLLNKAIDGDDSSATGACRPSPIASETNPKILSDFEDDFRQALDDLHERHIFQWSTFYRDCLTTYFGRYLSAVNQPSVDDSFEAVSAPLADHAYVAFSKGYEFVRGRSGDDAHVRIRSSATHSQNSAITKSLGGLSQFLSLLLDFYSGRSAAVSGYGPTLALRGLISAAISGVLEGYSRVGFGTESGKAILPRLQRQWVPYIAFLTPDHAKRVIGFLEPGPLRTGLNVSVLPLLDALQEFFLRENDDYWPIPVAGQYSWLRRRLSISVRPPRSSISHRLIEVAAFLEAGFVDTEDLREAAARKMVLILAPLKPDVQKIVEGHETLNAVVVPVDQIPADTEEEGARVRSKIASSAFRRLEKILHTLRGKLEADSPITYNFAREFPLEDPSKQKFFHVARTSVRDLLRTFERRNGVRLWCSVRRSGKTTACLDMETTTGDSNIVPQTCGASQREEATLFYRKVRGAVASRKIISETFLNETLMECARTGVDSERTVLIVDEYETLFGLMRNAVKDDATIRYNVVQPILDQLAEFSHNNLLVFLGQQPDAHFIVMDQNQLAPLVTQDPFPLFEHIRGTATGEFSELVSKILAGNVECTAAFLDALYDETAGHPYLTAKILMDFVEFLIEKRRRQIDLEVREGDFVEYSNGKLDSNSMLRSSEYEFFKHAAAEALSGRGYRDNPWLFATYWILRIIANEDSKRFRINLSSFEELFTRIPIPQGGNLPDSSEILRTASRANFLFLNEDYVNVRVRTLGRIAAAAQPALA